MLKNNNLFDKIDILCYSLSLSLALNASRIKNPLSNMAVKRRGGGGIPCQIPVCPHDQKYRSLAYGL